MCIIVQICTISTHVLINAALSYTLHQKRELLFCCMDCGLVLMYTWAVALHTEIVCFFSAQNVMHDFLTRYSWKCKYVYVSVCRHGEYNHLGLARLVMGCVTTYVAMSMYIQKIGQTHLLEIRASGTTITLSRLATLISHSSILSYKQWTYVVKGSLHQAGTSYTYIPMWGEDNTPSFFCQSSQNIPQVAASGRVHSSSGLILLTGITIANPQIVAPSPTHA